MTGSIFNRVKEASSDGGLHLTHYKQQYLALACMVLNKKLRRSIESGSAECAWNSSYTGTTIMCSQNLTCLLNVIKRYYSKNRFHRAYLLIPSVKEKKTSKYHAFLPVYKKVANGPLK